MIFEISPFCKNEYFHQPLDFSTKINEISISAVDFPHFWSDIVDLSPFVCLPVWYLLGSSMSPSSVIKMTCTYLLYLLFLPSYPVQGQAPEIPQYHFRDFLFFAIFIRETQYSFVIYLYFFSQFPATVFHLSEFFSRVSSWFLIVFSYCILETFENFELPHFSLQDPWEFVFLIFLSSLSSLEYSIIKLRIFAAFFVSLQRLAKNLLTS